MNTVLSNPRESVKTAAKPLTCQHHPTDGCPILSRTLRKGGISQSRHQRLCSKPEPETGRQEHRGRARPQPCRKPPPPTKPQAQAPPHLGLPWAKTCVENHQSFHPSPPRPELGQSGLSPHLPLIFSVTPRLGDEYGFVQSARIREDRGEAFDMPAPPNRRVPHPFAHFAKGWDITQPATRGLLETRTRNRTPRAP